MQIPWKGTMLEGGLSYFSFEVFMNSVLISSLISVSLEKQSIT